MADFILEVTTSDGGPLSDAEAASLRRALTDHGAVSATPAGQARFADPATLLAVSIGAIQTAAALSEVINFLRSWRGSRGARVRIAGAELPAEQVGEDSPFIAAVLRRATKGDDSRRRHALVIAVNAYDDPGLSSLRSPSTDANALSEVLRDNEIGGYQVDVLRDADERTVRRRIGEFFADRDPDDLLLLHFSCHGVKDRQNRLHLAARDTELRSLGATSIPASFVDSQMGQTAARRVVLVLDCCFSGAYASDMTTRGDRTVNIDDEFGHSGRVVLTASSATEYAFEGTQLTDSAAQPSIFTAALVEGLRTGNADVDGDGQITVDDWYTYAYRAVTTAGAGQAPTKSSTGVSGAFIVASSVRGAPIPSDLREDLESDRVPMRLAAVERLAAMAVRGGGTRITATRELRRLASEDDSVRVRAAAAKALGDNAIPEPRQPPAVPELAAQQPAAQQAAAQQAAAQQAATQQAATQEPVARRAAAQQAATQEPATQEPVARRAAAQQPVAQQPAVHKPVAQEPVVRSAGLSPRVLRITGALFLLAVVLRVLSGEGSFEKSLHPTMPSSFADLGVLILLVVAGFMLAFRPRVHRPVLAIVAGVAPWAAWTLMSTAFYALYKGGEDELSTWSRLFQFCVLVFASGLLLWTQRQERQGNQVRGYLAATLAVVILVMAMVGTKEGFSPASLAGPSGLAAATLSLTIVYFGAAVQSLRPYVLSTWAVAGGAWLLTGGQAGLDYHDGRHPSFLPAATMVPLLLMLVLAIVAWPDRPVDTARVPAGVSRSAAGLVIGSLVLWILVSTVAWPASQLWLYFLPIASAAAAALAVFRRREAAAFLAGSLGWPLTLAAAGVVSPDSGTPTVQGGLASEANPIVALLWGLVTCAVLVLTLGYLRSAPRDTRGPQWTVVAGAIALFALGVTTWMCWYTSLNYALLAGLLVAAPAALLRRRPAAEVAAAVLASVTMATPVLVTLFIYGYGYEYSDNWRFAGVGVGVVTFALGAAMAAMAMTARRPAEVAAGR